MKYLELYEDFNNIKWMMFIENIMKQDFIPLTDEIWDSIESDGYTEEVNDYNGDYVRSHYKYTEVIIPDEDVRGLINMEDNYINKWNDFDIAFKSEGYYPGYLDFIDYDNGKIYVIKHEYFEPVD